MRNLITAVIILAAVNSPGAEIQDGRLAGHDITFRGAYETLTLPGNEKMGLASVSYLVNFTPWFYSGAGVYSAEYGKRGGFFTGGIDSGLNINLFSAIYFNPGFFIGGGGGGAAPQGGGLMLRPYAGIMNNFGIFSIGGGVSRDIFPNGDIDSTQFYLAADIPFSIILFNDSGSAPDFSGARLQGLSFNRHRIQAIYEQYLPDDGVKTTDGHDAEDMGLAGISWSVDYSRHFFMHLHAAGAMIGDSDGYAELFGGGGGRIYITDSSGVEVKLSAGGAGGGRVDTGGGFVCRAGGGGFVTIAESVALSLDGYYLSAPSGSFRAKGFTVSMGGEFDILSPGDKDDEAFAEGYFTPGRWRVRFSGKSYLPSDNMRKNTDSRMRVDLMSFKIDRFFSEHFYLAGHAVGAYAGEAGGYAEGLFGAGLISGNIFYGIRLFAEAAAGAAGGGGLSTDGGAVFHPMAGLSWDINSSVSIEISGGLIKALNGRLFSPVVEAGAGYRFSFIQRKAYRMDSP